MDTWKRHLIETALDHEVAWKVAVAIETLLGREGEFIQLGGNERAITHRLAVYLEPLFPSWHVDCEYNREGAAPKRNSAGKLVLPDVIIHRRMTSENLLVIEVKTGPSVQEARLDKEKLRDYRRRQGYQHALFVDLNSIYADSAGALEWANECSDT